jgi:hypothetical protein
MSIKPVGAVEDLPVAGEQGQGSGQILAVDEGLHGLRDACQAFGGESGLFGEDGLHGKSFCRLS